MTSDAVFTRDGEAFVPSIHARGPWDAGSLHGGAPAALLARAIEALETTAPMRCVRLSVEFPRAVPLEPVLVSARLTRPGRKLALAEARLTTLDGTEVLRATATLLRRGDVALPASATISEPTPVPGPDDGRVDRWQGGDETQGFHLSAIELRFARGDWGRGPALGWFRLKLPVVAGEEPSPLQRAAAFADFGNGVSRALDFREHLFINTDLTVHLHREPVGEWVALDARTDFDRSGVGQSTSILRDQQGRIGIAAQSLFVDERA